MSSQPNKSSELNRAHSGEAPMTGDDRLAKAPARLNELLEHGEISAEAIAEYPAPDRFTRLPDEQTLAATVSELTDSQHTRRRQAWIRRELKDR